MGIRAALIAGMVLTVMTVSCAGGRASAVWSDHDKAGWNQFCTTRAHLPATRCACYQHVFQTAGKTYSQIHKSVLNAPSLTTPPPQESQVFQTAAQTCP